MTGPGANQRNLTVEDRALTAADKAYRAAMAPRDGDDPVECMWQAVFAVRDVYEAEVERLRNIIEVAAEYLRQPWRTASEGSALAALALDKVDSDEGSA